ncbi:MAG TPA: pyridoxamine 5'-phosphate oxidase family protein [Stellaceae bacterium]|nr:pyridoxamine 5'-phosphate oxidase family protein [Stellaceae bacterium]
MSDAHPPSDPHSPDPLSLARQLLHDVERATLGTLSAEGWPYGSLVLIAGDAAGRPILLLSDLAMHTRNLKADTRVSLLIDGTGDFDDPLTGPRVTVLGRVAETDDPIARQAFLDRHPAATLYAGFADFRVYRIDPTEAHLVAGFGRIHRLDGSDLITP